MRTVGAVPLRFASVDAIEAALGDPLDPANPHSFSALSELDRGDRFPTETVEALDELKVADYYVPTAHGGRLDDYVELSWIIRAMARRNITLAVAHGKTYLGAASVWIGATPSQQARLSELIRSGVPVSWGLTERPHGSDLLAGDAALEGSSLSGAKWLINNATRGGAIVALVRTSAGRGPRGFDLVLVDKATALRPDGSPAYRTLPKEPTLGIRGADISGIEFLDVEINENAVISQPGHGVEVVMKALQLTRTLCCSLSLGASDRALHTAVDFAKQRRIHGRVLIDFPQARRVLSDALSDHILNEAVTLAVLRSIHSLPGELSVHAASAKYFVPTRTEALLASLRGFVGARSYLDPDHAAGPPLSRTERDHRIVSLFDGNTVVNLTTLISQFPFLGRSEMSCESRALNVDVPQVDLDKLSLLSRTGSTILNMLPDGVNQLCELDLPAEVQELGSLIDAAGSRVHLEATSAERNPIDVPDRNFAIAERLAAAVAGAAAVQVFLAHVDRAESTLWKDALWLRLALTRALSCLDDGAPTSSVSVDHDAAVAYLLSNHAQDRGYSLFRSPKLEGAG